MASPQFHRNIQFTILQYLNSQKEQIDVSKRETLETTLQNLESVFGLSRNEQSLSLGKPLELLLQQYAPASPPTEIDVEKEVGFEQKLSSYINVLKSKKYFDGAVEGSVEYQQRYQKAKEKLVQRLKEEANQKSEKKRFEEAEGLKAEGNKHLQEKRFKEAIDSYTKAIQLNGGSAIYYCNRAAAYTHLQEYQKAIDDCQVSINCDPKYSKAYSRLALAHFSLKNYPEAVEGYRKALELDPNNQPVREALKAAEEKAGKSSGGGMGGMGGMGGGTGGGMPPGMGDLFNNPNLMQMAQNMASQPGFADLLNNPNLASMAQNLMQNPEAMNMLQQMMKGQGGPGGNSPLQQE